MTPPRPQEFAVRDAEDAPASKTIHAFITELKENQTWLVGALTPDTRRVRTW